MVQVSFFTRIVVALILIAGILIALPNALPQSARSRLPAWWGGQTVSLGLDLQGGSYLLLEVQLDEVQKDKIDSLRGDIRRALRKAHIAFKFNDVSANSGTISLSIVGHERFADARAILDNLNPLANGGVLSVGAHQYEISEPGADRLVMRMSDTYLKQAQQDIVNQSIEVVRKRIDELGTREPTIERQGDDRIVVQVPGLSDPSRLIKILKTTAKMTFQLVDESADIEQARQGIVPIGSELLHRYNADDEKQRGPVVVQKRVLVAGDRLTDARQDFDSQSGQPDVAFKFDSVGAKEFGDVTKDNVGHRFAIVLDKKVITDPVIQQVILGGSGQITGNFTVQGASDLAILLRAGALPAPLKPIDQRTVGAELGADSVKAGGYSTMAGLLLVILFMIGRYGLFGVFADVALVFNVILLIATLTMLGATLTLPGIAGIVLTMGMAVDANVLIFERIREEQRNGRGMIASIDAGFRRAMATIIDANATHLIASLILFELGSGPVRGFAVTLGLGIITSFFTAVMVTRLMVVLWLVIRRPKTLTI
ncbi:MAG TPA: protein translocase subunit SecD [Rhizomicrobium sp.]|jgi:SecD/SecF fusion protein|nr:protein translocase subunit SecD [Rhizomicrobium sp.]